MPDYDSRWEEGPDRGRKQRIKAFNSQPVYRIGRRKFKSLAEAVRVAQEIFAKTGVVVAIE